MRYLKKEKLNRHTSFRMGGPADYFCVPKNKVELKEAIEYAKSKKIPVAVIGGGTNLLALDSGFRGLVIKLAGGLTKVLIRERMVYASAGVKLPQLLNLLARRGLSGLEFMAGIPGTLGGAVIMNAGAWGKQIGKFVRRVKVMNGKGEEAEIEGKRLKLGYRQCLLQDRRQILTEAVLRLRKGRTTTIRKKMSKFLRCRRESQPLGIPNAGCIFKNPAGKFAGKLLEEAGCKGMRVGDAQVSGKHANFIVNLGEAKARDILRLMSKMQKAVKIKLEPEIRLVVKSPL